MQYEVEIKSEGFSEHRCFACRILQVAEDGIKTPLRRFGVKRFNERMQAEMATGKFIQNILARRKLNGNIYG